MPLPSRVPTRKKPLERILARGRPANGVRLARRHHFARRGSQNVDPGRPHQVDRQVIGIDAAVSVGDRQREGVPSGDRRFLVAGQWLVALEQRSARAAGPLELEEVTVGIGAGAVQQHFGRVGGAVVVARERRGSAVRSRRNRQQDLAVADEQIWKTVAVEVGRIEGIQPQAVVGVARIATLRVDGKGGRQAECAVATAFEDGDAVRVLGQVPEAVRGLRDPVRVVQGGHIGDPVAREIAEHDGVGAAAGRILAAGGERPLAVADGDEHVAVRIRRIEEGAEATGDQQVDGTVAVDVAGGHVGGPAGTARHGRCGEGEVRLVGQQPDATVHVGHGHVGQSVAVHIGHEGGERPLTP